jgi:pyrroloquinoline-quinone synthase
MTRNELWQAVEGVLAEYDLLKHPFYQAWSQGQLTGEQLAFYGEQYVEHVAAFPTYLTALHARQPEGELRRALLMNAADEEIDGRSHAELWRQFVRGMGGEAKAEAVLPEMEELVSTYRGMATGESAATALGAFYAYESQVPRVAEEKRSGLKAHYGADDATCEYFTVHTTADVHHSNVWRQLINRCVDQDAACAEEVVDGARRGAAAQWRALDGIEATRSSLLVARC